MKQNQLKEEREKAEKRNEELYQQRLEFWSKKKVGFVNLKSWQEERMTILGLHKKILDSIFTRTVEKLKISARESQKIIQYFLARIDWEKSYSDNILKNITYMAEVKQTYQNCGKGLFDLCEGIEAYENNIAKDKLQASKAIKQIIDETLGAVFKEQIRKTDEFVHKVNKIFRKLGQEEKDTEKAYQGFTNMLEEAESCMNSRKNFDKDFWLAENQCLVTSTKQADRHTELAKEIIDIWGKAEAIEEVRIKNIKQLYDNYFSKTLIMNDHSKKLIELIAKTDEDTISSKIYCHKNMFTEEDLRAFGNLVDLFGKKVDFLAIETPEVKDILLNIKIREAPQTTFIMREGSLKRDPGFMKSWKDVI